MDKLTIEDEAIILGNNWIANKLRQSFIEDCSSTKPNISEVRNKCKPVIVDKNCYYYFCVFKPFDKNYQRDLPLYKSDGFNHVLKKLKLEKGYVMTRETESAKIHINILFKSDTELLFPNKFMTNRYMIFAQECVSKEATLEYIIKESKHRNFIQQLDYDFSV